MKPRAAVFQSKEIKRMRLIMDRWSFQNKSRFYADKWTPRASKIILRLKMNEINAKPN